MIGRRKLKIFGLLVCLAIFLAGAVAAEERSVDTESELGVSSPDYGFLKADKCSCKNGVCEKNEKGELVCKCPVEWGLYDSTTCQRCNCGVGSSCTFEANFWGTLKPKCICKKGTGVNGDKCQKCNCGKDFNCKFSTILFRTTKTCLCEKGYKESGDKCVGTCKENPCLNNGECKVKGTDIECVCKESYSGDLCEKKTEPSTVAPTTRSIPTTKPTVLTTPTTSPRSTIRLSTTKKSPSTTETKPSTIRLSTTKKSPTTNKTRPSTLKLSTTKQSPLTTKTKPSTIRLSTTKKSPSTTVTKPSTIRLSTTKKSPSTTQTKPSTIRLSTTKKSPSTTQTKPSTIRLSTTKKYPSTTQTKPSTMRLSTTKKYPSTTETKPSTIRLSTTKKYPSTTETRSSTTNASTTRELLSTKPFSTNTSTPTTSPTMKTTTPTTIFTNTSTARSTPTTKQPVLTTRTTSSPSTTRRSTTKKSPSTTETRPSATNASTTRELLSTKPFSTKTSPPTTSRTVRTTTPTTIFTDTPPTTKLGSTTIEVETENITDLVWNVTSNATDDLVTWTDNDTQSTTEIVDFNTTIFSNFTTPDDDNSSLPLTEEPDANTTSSRDGTNETTTELRTEETVITTAVTEDTVPTTTKETEGCKSNPCKNGGTCIREDNVEKCLCPYPYAGLRCTESHWCTEGLGQVLCEATKCDFNFKTRVGRCRCAKGQYYDYDKRKCQVVDRCPLTPEKCKGANEICKDNECQCAENFKRSDKKKCVPNFCETSKNVCGSDAKCEENENDPENVKCVCNENAVFNGKLCLKVNKCDVPRSLGCQQLCNATSETCGCHDGYTLQRDGKTCRLTTNATQCSKDCKPGVCYKTKGKETCICPPTHVFKDGSCKDLCSAKSVPPGLCPGDACEPHPTLGFRCKCDDLSTYDTSNVTCRRKLMCSEGNGMEVCSNRSAKCMEDIHSEAGFHCKCADSHEMDADEICRSKCDLKSYQDKCGKQKAVCDMEGSEAVCKCPPLLTVGGNGICEELAKSSYSGTVPFEKNKYDVKSLYAPGAKPPNTPDFNKMRKDLRSSMKLLYGSNYKFADIWDCNDTASSLSCTVEVQFQSDPRDQVKLIGDSETCISSGADTCLIPPQLILRKKDVTSDLLTRTDPCTEKIKLTNCGGQETVCNKTEDDSGNFECTCNQGFASYGVIYPVTDRQTVIHKCQDIDECSLPKACPNRTRCMNTFGSYECLCQEGHRPLTGTADPKVYGCVGLCDGVSCGKRGKCEVNDFGYGFKCKCNEGYTGTECEMKSDVVKVGGDTKGMQVALISLSTIVIPLALFAAYMVYKYRILSKQSSSTAYLDDNTSHLSMQPLRP